MLMITAIPQLMISLSIDMIPADMGDFDRMAIFDRLLAAAAEPVYLGDLELRVTVSIGITVFPQADEMNVIDASTLLAQADQAMYQAKVGGKNRYAVFKPAAAT